MLLRFALNQYGAYVHVTNANRSEAYYCPWCRCPMQVRRINGDLFFCAAPGAAHATKECKTLRYRFLDPWITSKDELKIHLLNKTDDKRNKKQKTEKNENVGLLQSGYDGLSYAIVPLRFLSDFRKNCMYNWPADTIVNGYRLTDLFVSIKNSAVLMNDNNPLGFRIVDVKFSNLIGKDTLQFASHCVSSDGKKIRYFNLVVKDREDYQILRNEVFLCRNARYYLAGIWESVDCEISKGGEWRLVGVQKTLW